ncbi:serine hydrolase [soil metagenome]
MTKITLFSFVIILFACSKSDAPAPTPSIYFPPNGSTWETATPASLGWDESKIPDLKNFLQTSNSRALIVLKDGKIIIEEYLGKDLNGTNSFTPGSSWYWASAGKTLTSVLVGIANGDGKIDLNARSSQYLGTGWTSLTLEQENKITVRHQLTMLSGLDDFSDPNSTGDKNCTLPACLLYKADAGTRWAYHTGAYTLLDGVINSGTGQTLVNYFNSKVRDVIGMDGSYSIAGYNNVFYSTPRSMARFGLLLLSKGKWNQTQVIPGNYFTEMTSASQNINLSYGYLTWLNGKNSFMSPGSQTVFPQKMCLNGPDDMFAALGKNGQIINVVPSKGIVVIRLGDSPDASLVPFNFQNDLWGKLNAIIK